MQDLFVKYNFFMQGDDQDIQDIQSYIYGIVEEYILLGFILPKDFSNVLQYCLKKYLIILQRDIKNETRKEKIQYYRIKQSNLNLAYTILLFVLYKNLHQLMPKFQAPLFFLP